MRQARVKANGALSAPFLIRYGTRQDCPLSPIIFALTLEPFIRTVKLNPDISGITHKAQNFKIAAYADDMIFFLTNPSTTLPSLLKAFQEFVDLSNLKINYTKSVALNITLDQSTVELAKSNFPFRRDDSHIRLLGINIPADTSRLIN